jgi:hypothetical protein
MLDTIVYSIEGTIISYVVRNSDDVVLFIASNVDLRTIILEIRVLVRVLDVIRHS